MRKLVSSSQKLLQVNFRGLICFELLYRLLTAFVWIPLITFAGKMIMCMMGFRYITQENMNQFILNPVTILLIFVLLLVAALIETWHVSTVLTFLDLSDQGKRISIYSAMKHAFFSGRWVLRKGNVLLPVYMMLMLPLLNQGTGLLAAISIPEHLKDFFLRSPLRLVGISAFYVIIFLLLLRWLFSLFYLVIEGDDFLTSARKSALLSKGNNIKNLSIFLLMNVLIVGGGYLLYSIGGLIIGLFYKLNFIATDLMISTIGVILFLLVFLVTVLATPIAYSVIYSLFQKRKEEKREEVKHLAIKIKKEKHTQVSFLERIISISVLVVTLVAGLFFVQGLRRGDYNLNVEYVRNTEITAHRGASAYYPENTMAAFRGAVEQKADWIELDVQQSSDGMIYVSHDTNFKRVTGLDRNCWEMTWEEISQLDAGSFFSSEYAGEKIPLLSEVIQYAKETDVRLNIELKPTGFEKEFEKSVVDIINEEDFMDSCVITSQVYEVLENIKAYDSSITTVLVTNSALGEIQEKECADNFSIEATFVTEDLVKKMHNLGKEVYAWTIDTEENIDLMLEIGVDNIITNNVPFARECREKSRHGNLIEAVINFIRKL